MAGLDRYQNIFWTGPTLVSLHVHVDLLWAL